MFQEKSDQYFFWFQGYNRKAKFIATQGMKRFRMVFFVTPFRPL